MPNREGEEDHAHRVWLRDASASWVEEGLVDAESLARIRARYALDAIPSRTSRSVLVFGVLGGALIIAGTSLLLAENWDQLSRPMRAAIAIGLLLLAQGVGAVALARSPRASAFTESAAVFLVGALGTAMALVSQTYHLGGELADLVLAWLALALPVPYLFGSRVAATFFWALLLYLPVGREDSWDRGLSFVALAALTVPVTVVARTRAPRATRTRVLWFATAVASTIGLGLLVGEHASGLVVPALVACAVLVRSFGRDEGRDATSTVATLFLGGMVVLLSTKSALLPIARELASRDAAVGVIVASVVVAFAVSVARVSRFSDEGRRASIPALAAIPFVVVVSLLAWTEHRTLGVALANVFLFGFGLEPLLRGLATLRRGPTNVGLALLSGLFVVRFFDDDLSFVVRGVGMMGIGVAFLAANLWLVRQRGEAS